MVIRPSRSEPWWVPHFLIAPYRSLSHVLSEYEIVFQSQSGDIPGVPEVVSFKPTNPTDEPWYKFWKHLLFRGKPRVGDRPDTHGVETGQNSGQRGDEEKDLGR